MGVANKMQKTSGRGGIKVAFKDASDFKGSREKNAQRAHKIKEYLILGLVLPPFLPPFFLPFLFFRKCRKLDY